MQIRAVKIRRTRVICGLFLHKAENSIALLLIRGFIPLGWEIGGRWLVVGGRWFQLTADHLHNDLQTVFQSD